VLRKFVSFAAKISTLGIVVVLAGCLGVGVRLYPVSGPLAAQTPVPVYPAKLTLRSSIRSGEFKTMLANGEQFNGRWTMQTPGPANPSSGDDLSEDWDRVFGPGFYVAHVLGDRDCGTATITGSAGTVLHLQLCGGNGQKAVGRDSHGNVYKITVS
jgi:hypothetical protein